MGFLKVLLGKPGTLHSPGHIFPSALGVPPDLRDASGFSKIGQVPRQGGDVAASPPIPRVGCASVTRQGAVPHPKRIWDRLSTRLPWPLFTYYSSPLRALLYHIVVVAYGSRGEGPAGSFGVCTPPHRQLLCGVAGSLFLPLY